MKYAWFFILLVAGEGMAELPLGETFKLISNSEVIVLDRDGSDYYVDIYEPETNAYVRSFSIGTDYLDITSGDLFGNGYDEIIGLYKTATTDYIYIIYKDGDDWFSASHNTNKTGQLYITCGDVLPDSEWLPDSVYPVEIITATPDSIFIWGLLKGKSGLVRAYEKKTEMHCVGSHKEQISDIGCGDVDGDGYDDIIYSMGGWTICCGNLEDDIRREVIALEDGGWFSNDKLHIFEWSEEETTFVELRVIDAGYKGLIDIVTGNVDTDKYDEIIALDNGKWARVYTEDAYEGSFELTNSSNVSRIAAGDYDGDNTRVVFVGGPYLCSSELWPNLVISLPPYQNGIVSGECAISYGEDYQQNQNLDATFSITAKTTIGFKGNFPGGLFDYNVSATIEAGVKKHLGENRTFTWGSWYRVSSNAGKNVVIATRTYYNGFLYKIIDPNNGLGGNLDQDTIAMGVPVASSTVLPMYLEDYLEYADTIDYLPKGLLLPIQEPGNVPSYPQGYVYPNGYQILPEDLLFVVHPIYHIVPEGIEGGWYIKLEETQVNEDVLYSKGNLVVKLNIGGSGFEIAGAVGATYTHSTKVGRKLEIKADMGYIPDSLDYWQWYYEYSPYIYHAGSDSGGFYVLNFMVQNLGDGYYGVEETNQAKSFKPFAIISQNPCRGKAEIRYGIGRTTQPIRITIYDQSGRLISNLVNERKEPGAYRTVWEPGDVGSGVYFCKFELGEYKTTRKIVLIR